MDLTFVWVAVVEIDSLVWVRGANRLVLVSASKFTWFLSGWSILT